VPAATATAGSARSVTLVPQRILTDTEPRDDRSPAAATRPTRRKKQRRPGDARGDEATFMVREEADRSVRPIRLTVPAAGCRSRARGRGEGDLGFRRRGAGETDERGAREERDERETK
jgi:hypothetical protein